MQITVCNMRTTIIDICCDDENMLIEIDSIYRDTTTAIRIKGSIPRLEQHSEFKNLLLESRVAFMLFSLEDMKKDFRALVYKVSYGEPRRSYVVPVTNVTTGVAAFSPLNLDPVFRFFLLHARNLLKPSLRIVACREGEERGLGTSACLSCAHFCVANELTQRFLGNHRKIYNPRIKYELAIIPFGHQETRVHCQDNESECIEVVSVVSEARRNDSFSEYKSRGTIRLSRKRDSRRLHIIN